MACADGTADGSTDGTANGNGARQPQRMAAGRYARAHRAIACRCHRAWPSSFALGVRGVAAATSRSTRPTSRHVGCGGANGCDLCSVGGCAGVRRRPWRRPSNCSSRATVAAGMRGGSCSRSPCGVRRQSIAYGRVRSPRVGPLCPLSIDLWCGAASTVGPCGRARGRCAMGGACRSRRRRSLPTAGARGAHGSARCTAGARTPPRGRTNGATAGRTCVSCCGCEPPCRTLSDTRYSIHNIRCSLCLGSAAGTLWGAGGPSHPQSDEQSSSTP